MENQEIVAFPAFLPSGHKFGNFSDAAFHASCFRNMSSSDEVKELYRRYREIWESRPKNLKTLEEIADWGKKAFKEFTE